jgi:hypothetical protein
MTDVRIWPSGRPRPGRRYEPVAELDLAPAAERACRALPGFNQDSLVIREMAGPYGIPDYTVLIPSRTAIASRLATSVPPLLNQADAVLVATLSTERPLSLDALSRRLRWPSGSIERHLRAIAKSGAALQVERDRWLRCPGIAPLGRMYAVETKVSNWRRALQQVRTYTVWADAYVLVMGSLRQSTVESLEQEVKQDSGGLVHDGRFVVRPRVTFSAAGLRLWASEHLVAALHDYQPSERR